MTVTVRGRSCAARPRAISRARPGRAISSRETAACILGPRIMRASRMLRDACTAARKCGPHSCRPRFAARSRVHGRRACPARPAASRHAPLLGAAPRGASRAARGDQWRAASTRGIPPALRADALRRRAPLAGLRLRGYCVCGCRAELEDEFRQFLQGTRNAGSASALRRVAARSSVQYAKCLNLGWRISTSLSHRSGISRP